MHRATHFKSSGDNDNNNGSIEIHYIVFSEWRVIEICHCIYNCGLRKSITSELFQEGQEGIGNFLDKSEAKIIIIIIIIIIITIIIIYKI